MTQDDRSAAARLDLSPSPGAPWNRPLRGQLVQCTLRSQALRGNHLGDPPDRPLWILLPPQYGAEPERRFPVIYVLQGFSGQVDMWAARSPFQVTGVESFDAFLAEPDLPPCLLVLVDAWTSLGGSQYLDSPGTGRYHTYLCEEVVAAVDANFRTLAERSHRAVAGKSSGGFGALVSALLRPDLFGAVASHAGDALFEYCYLPEFPEVVRLLRDHYGGSYQAFWEDFRSRPPLSRPGDHPLVSCWCLGACYSAGPRGEPELPFDLGTGRLQLPVWERWLAWDPVRLVAERAEAARSLLGVYLDGGRRDEWHLEVAATALEASLHDLGTPNVHLELFDGGHMGINYRYPVGLRYLARLIAG